MPRALVVVDLMAGIFELPEPLHRPDAFLANVGLLLERARESGTPVVYIRHLGPEGSYFAPGAPAGRIDERFAPRATEIVVEKRHPDSFQDSKLEAHLRELSIDEIVVCGFASEACVDTTVRGAYARGFKVVLAADAHTTTKNPVLEAEQIVAHHNFVLSRFARLAPADQAFAPTT
jgi:nicotinamidase-related amidase